MMSLKPIKETRYPVSFTELLPSEIVREAHVMHVGCDYELKAGLGLDIRWTS